MEYSVDRPGEQSAAAARGPISALFRSVAHLLATAVGIAHTRLDLLSNELQQEVHRVAEIMVWTAIALLAGGIGLFVAALTIIFAFWDTHRLLASIAVTAVFFLGALVAGVVLMAKVRSKPRLLDATLTELAKDRAALLSKQ